MYLPPHFNRSDDRALAVAIMRENSFASLISNDDEGFPYVTHLPLHVEERENGDIVLLGHCAKPNPHWKYLAARPKALVTFMGPHAYMSPSVYPDLARVPTWNYLAVHCQVEATPIEGDENTDAMLKCLIGDNEPAYAEQWRALGEEYAHKMMKGISAFELRVTALQCKVKINQHRKESHAALYSQYSQGTADEQALAAWMKRLGLNVQADSDSNSNSKSTTAE